MEWNKRAKREDNVTSERRTWRSKCGHYKVEESNIKYGRKTDSRGNFQGYPIRYRAMREHEGMWCIISNHRKKSTAMAQCEYFYTHGSKEK